MDPAVHQKSSSGDWPIKDDSSRRILLVDDNEMVRGVLKEMLSLAGFSVDEVADGVQALRALAATSYDAIITDLVMPDCDGIELLRTIRREYPHLRVLAMSGAPSAPLYLKAARALGAGVALPKPISRDALIAAVTGLFAA